MKYCLCVGVHNLFFDIAIVDDKHQIMGKYKCDYDRNKDIARNIFNAYEKYFFKYKIVGVGVGISNNVDYKDGYIHKITAFNINRYNLKQSLSKLFRNDIYILDDTNLASVALSYILKCNSLLYLVLDNKISNSIIFDHRMMELDNNMDLKNNSELNSTCSKPSLKNLFLSNGFDDDNICLHFLSNKKETKKLIAKWSNELEEYIIDIVENIKVDCIAFAGFIGSYYDSFKEYFHINQNIKCLGINNHRDLTLIGASCLIFKDN